MKGLIQGFRWLNFYEALKEPTQETPKWKLEGLQRGEGDDVPEDSGTLHLMERPLKTVD